MSDIMILQSVMIIYILNFKRMILNYCLLMIVNSREKLNSMNLLLYMAPIAVVLLLPTTLLMEPNVLGITITLARADVEIIFYLLFILAITHFVNLTNFLVTKHTGPLTFQVCCLISSKLVILLCFKVSNDVVSCLMLYMEM